MAIIMDVRFQNQLHEDAWDRVDPLLSPQMRMIGRSLGKLLQANGDPKRMEFAVKEISVGASHLGAGTWLLKLLHAAGLILHTAHGPRGVSIVVLWPPLAGKLRDL